MSYTQMYQLVISCLICFFLFICLSLCRYQVLLPLNTLLYISFSYITPVQFSSVQSLSRVRLFATPWIAARQASLFHHQLPEFTQIHIHRVSDAIQPSHPRSSPSPAANPSQHQSLFQWVNSSHEVAKVLELQLQHHSFQRNPRTDLLHNGLVGSPCSPRDSRVFSNTTVQKHQFFGIQPFSVQLSHPYMTTGKTIALTRWTLVGKVMSLLFNMVSRLVITFLPRNKRLLISWLQSPSAVILEPPQIKSDTVSTVSRVSQFISHEVMGPDAMILVFWMLSFKPTFSLSSFTFIKRLFSSFECVDHNKQ